MTVATRTSFAVSELAPPVVASDVHLPVPVASDVKLVKRQIVDSSLELNRQAAELNAATRGTWSVVQHSWLQRSKALIDKEGFISIDGVAASALVGGVGGGGLGALVGWATATSSVGWAVGIPVAALCAALVPAAAVLKRLAMKEERVTRGKMVEVAQIQGALQRFGEASGASKVQIASGLRKLHASLFDGKAASPEALAALKNAIAEGEGLKSTYGDRVRQFDTLGAYVTGDIDGAAVLQIESVLNELGPAERPVVAHALRELFFDDRTRVAAMPFEVRNKLHDVLTTATASQTLEQKS